jgi:DNA topoisomerase-1
MPGISRIRCRGQFRFTGVNGKLLKDEATLKRIRALAVPPAWTDVWICPVAKGHLQATGRDARGRKQYVYHPQWRETREETKFNRLIAFGKALPRIRRRIREDLRRPGLGREKVLASVVRLLDLSAIRVGNEEYATQNHSYGLTTLEDRHARVNGSRIQLRFRGKAGRQHVLSIKEPTLARIVKKCQDLPGQELFEWVDEAGGVHDVTSGDVNDYLSEIGGENFTSKDFRTWAGTVLAARALRQCEDSRTGITRAVESVAGCLGNTPAVCRKAYIHPALFQAYHEGLLAPGPGKAGSRTQRATTRLRAEEAQLLRILKEKARENAPGGLARKLRESLRVARTRRRRRKPPI